MLAFVVLLRDIAMRIVRRSLVVRRVPNQIEAHDSSATTAIFLRTWDHYMLQLFCILLSIVNWAGIYGLYCSSNEYKKKPTTLAKSISDLVHAHEYKYKADTNGRNKKNKMRVKLLRMKL